MLIVGVGAFSGKPMEKFIGEWSCKVLYFLDTFGVIHSFVAGMGLAIMRLLYIRYSHKLYKIQNARFYGGLVMCGGTYVVSFITTMALKMSQDKDHPTAMTLCLGRSQQSQEILFNYLSDGSKVYNWLTICIHIFLLLCFLVELIIYQLLFKFMLNHESSLKPIESMALKKLKQNVFTLHGQIITFMVQALFWGFITLINVFNVMSEDLTMVWVAFIFDASLSAIQIIYSPNLRAETVHILNSLKR